MRRTLLSAVLFTVVGLAPVLSGQQRPDFSGRWELVADAARANDDPHLPFGDAFTIKQTDAGLTLTHVIEGRGNTAGARTMSMVVTVFNFDGSKNNLTTVFTGSFRSESYSTSAWDGDHLVNSSFSTPSQTPLLPTAKMVFRLNASGELVIERHTNLNGPTPETVVSSVYKKGG